MEQIFGHKEAVIIRKMYVVGIKKIGPFRKRILATINEFAQQISDKDFTFDYSRKILYKLVKMGGLEPVENGYYKINEQKLDELLSEDELFKLDKEILENKFIFINR